MIRFIVQAVLSALAIGFAGWVGYIVYLGLNQFFGGKNGNTDKDKE